MAVSPIVVEYKNEVGVKEGKRMSIPMRIQENGVNRKSDITMVANTGKELAEQLNEETKKKYIKSELEPLVVKGLRAEKT